MIEEIGAHFLVAWATGYGLGFLIYTFRKIGENVV